MNISDTNRNWHKNSAPQKPSHELSESMMKKNKRSTRSRKFLFKEIYQRDSLMLLQNAVGTSFFSSSNSSGLFTLIAVCKIDRWMEDIWHTSQKLLLHNFYRLALLARQRNHLSCDRLFLSSPSLLFSSVRPVHNSHFTESLELKKRQKRQKSTTIVSSLRIHDSF